MTEMSLTEARELLRSPLWKNVREQFAKTGEWKIYPPRDPRRLEYADEATRQEIQRWMDAIQNLPSFQKVINGADVRQLTEQYPGIYPEILRLAPYFAGKSDPLPTLLKLKFPETYTLWSC